MVIGMEIILITTLFINIFSGKALTHFILLVRSLQIIIHLILMKVLVPSNVTMVFKTIMDIVMYELIDSELTTERILAFDYDSQD